MLEEEEEAESVLSEYKEHLSMVTMEKKGEVTLLVQMANL